MTSPQSPTKVFNGLDGNAYSDARFSQEIDSKMRVPKRIKATGEASDEDSLISKQNGYINSWNYRDKIDMSVPDRIVVLGDNKHLETRSAPREIQLESSTHPGNLTDFVRVQTPPRTITLTEHPFPTASEDSSPVANNMATSADLPMDLAQIEGNSDTGSQITTGTVSARSQPQLQYNGTLTPQENLTLAEVAPSVEIRYLRGQIARLSQRVQNIEISNEQHIQREKMLWGLSIAYVLWKTISWLSR